MEKTKSLRKNTLLNTLLAISSVLIPLITFPYFSRILLPEGMGKVSFAASLISYFVMFAQLGIPTYGVKLCAGIRDNKLELTRAVHELFFINLVMTVLSYGVFFLALFCIPRLQAERMLYLMMGLGIVCNAFGIDWLYQALEEYGSITVRSITCRVIALLAMWLLIHYAEDYVLYGGLSILASALSNILNFLCAGKHVSMRPIGGYHLRRHLEAIVTFFAMAVATTVYTNLDTAMLGFMTTDTDVGYYYAAVKVKGVLLGLITSAGAVLLPRASYYVKEGRREAFIQITGKALNLVILMAAPLMVYFMLFAKQSILFLSGPSFAGAILPMQIIMPTLLCIGITHVLGIQILVPQGKEKTVLYSELIGAAVDVILNVILIPCMASAGAAIGTLAAEITVLVVQCIVLRGELADWFCQIRFGWILLALLLSTISSAWTIILPFGSFWVLLLSACLFFGTYGVFLWIVGEPMVVEVADQVWNLIVGRTTKCQKKY